MVKFINSGLKTLALSVIFFGSWAFILNVTKSWTWTDWLTAESGDTLTVEKWNSLTSKVDEALRTIVPTTDTTNFDVKCQRRFLGKFSQDWKIRQWYATQVADIWILTYFSNTFLRINPSNKWVFSNEWHSAYRTLLKLEKNCN